MRKHWYHKLAPVTSVLFLAHVDYILVISHSRILEFLIPGVLEGPYNGKSYRSKEVQEAFGQVFHKVKKDLWRAKFSLLFPQVLLGNLIARAIGYLPIVFAGTSDHHVEDNYYRKAELEGLSKDDLIVHTVNTCTDTNGSRLGEYVMGFTFHKHLVHHLFPFLPGNMAPGAQEQLREICARHGVFYRDEDTLSSAFNVFKRVHVVAGYR